VRVKAGGFVTFYSADGIEHERDREIRYAGRVSLPVYDSSFDVG
jgi:hypothetical protein